MHVIQKICHRVAIMENGSIVEQGHVLDVFRNPSHSVTKRFVKQVVNEEESLNTLETLSRQFPEGKIILLKYFQENAEKPFITNVIRQYDVEINIIHGKVVQTQEGSYGSLYVQLIGNEINSALEYLQGAGVEIEVMEQ